MADRSQRTHAGAGLLVRWRRVQVARRASRAIVYSSHRQRFALYSTTRAGPVVWEKMGQVKRMRSEDN